MDNHTSPRTLGFGCSSADYCYAYSAQKQECCRSIYFRQKPKFQAHQNVLFVIILESRNRRPKETWSREIIKPLPVIDYYANFFLQILLSQF